MKNIPLDWIKNNISFISDKIRKSFPIAYYNSCIEAVKLASRYHPERAYTIALTEFVSRVAEIWDANIEAEKLVNVGILAEQVALARYFYGEIARRECLEIVEKELFKEIGKSKKKEAPLTIVV